VTLHERVSRRATTEVDTSQGYSRLKLNLTLAWDFNFLKKDAPGHFVIPMEKDLTLWLKFSPSEGRNIPWLIDGCMATSTSGSRRSAEVPRPSTTPPPLRVGSSTFPAPPGLSGTATSAPWRACRRPPPPLRPRSFMQVRPGFDPLV